ncbi:MdtA/MuxA family multidrug efflux RND transporter periplasmic adaptor subunit [Horticoccus sp. 23ND18S-11]|uniref:MdtA/MuxA family multidrug efflux RND transporter periplasmic adaptor subunit n=1 Tax=Horticoccus sp. 23ND18S-11 TaxID=3391832 RepID=UPI0039C99C9E
MSHPPPARRRWFLYGLVALIFAAGVWYFGFRAEVPKPTGGMSFRSSRKSNAAIPVRAEAARKTTLAVQLRAIGTVVPLNIVSVRSRVEGQLLRVAFEEGQQVTQGQLLAEIDPLPYKIRLSQMEAQQRQNQAQLNTAKADLERFKQLHAQNLVTQQQLDTQQSLVVEREGAVAAEQALVDDARRQLAYTKVEAPIAGRLGLRQMDVGNLVRPGDANGLVVITQTRPIAVLFTVPENDLQKVVEPLRAGNELVVEAWDRNDAKQLATGVLKTVDNQIDLSTGTLRLKAEFPNADESLFPNQFVNVRLRVRTLPDALVVPAQAVQFGSRGTYVYVANAELKATVRDVVLGPSDGPNQSITKGLEAGELVVTEGVDRLREGRIVVLVGDESAPAAKSGKGGEKGEKGKRGEKAKKDK